MDGDSGPMGLLTGKGEKRPAYAALAQMIKTFGQHPTYLGWVLLTRRKLKAFWHDADDGALQAIEVGFAADDVGIACKNALPRTIRNVRYHLCSRRIVRWRYPPPRNWGHAQRFQQRKGRLHHGRRAAHIAVCAPQITGEPLNHIRDQSGLAVPAVVIARLGQGRYVLEVRQLLLERVHRLRQRIEKEERRCVGDRAVSPGSGEEEPGRDRQHACEEARHEPGQDAAGALGHAQSERGEVLADVRYVDA